MAQRKRFTAHEDAIHVSRIQSNQMRDALAPKGHKALDGYP